MQQSYVNNISPQRQRMDSELLIHQETVKATMAVMFRCQQKWLLGDHQRKRVEWVEDELRNGRVQAGWPAHLG